MAYDPTQPVPPPIEPTQYREWAPLPPPSPSLPPLPPPPLINPADLPYWRVNKRRETWLALFFLLFGAVILLTYFAALISGFR